MQQQLKNRLKINLMTLFELFISCPKHFTKQFWIEYQDDDLENLVSSSFKLPNSKTPHPPPPKPHHYIDSEMIDVLLC